MTDHNLPSICFGDKPEYAHYEGPAKHNWAIESVGLVLSGVSELLVHQDAESVMSSDARYGVDLMLRACVKQLEWTCQQNRQEEKLIDRKPA